ncbi:hypothetical protein SLEP1_g23649 [Rubroshorea leprosula]|uniref:Protein kinase domain-containing protein n=1 Tax=Rubroshorea leprosula TaxID=152421 RepID=A0AAV5JD13_9ROSI|nr:hypothetical protein SLEP1_g23649 [Rubroshorea leprosula]
MKKADFHLQCSIVLQLLFVCFQTHPVTALSSANETDKLALLAIKGRITQDIYGLMNAWNESIHFCDWIGVTCSRRHRGRVTLLSLERCGLIGSIPPQIGNLSFLRGINLAENIFQGEIPQEIRHLFRLRFLNAISLGPNYFTGQLPVSLSNASQLKLVGFGFNNLIGPVPWNLGRLSALEKVSLVGNQLENAEGDDFGFITSLTNCSKLSLLATGDNRFKGQFLICQASLNYCLCGEIRFQIVWRNSKYFGKLSYAGEPLHARFEGEVPYEGVFRNATEVSIVGNQNLCGGIEKLELPPCKIQGLKKNERRSNIQPSAMLQTQEVFPMISYAELSQATNNFSSANLIGVRSFGSVYKGIIGENGMLVAVKVLNLKQKGASKSFVAECEALRNIQEWLHSQRVPVGVRHLSFIQRLNIAIEVASAFEYFHYHCQPTIVHGDLKPSNILLDHEMVAHVILFKYRIKSVFYILEYGMGGKPSTAGDVSSFGILLLEMNTGRRPTDAIFKEGLNLHQFTKLALPDRVMDIVEPSLLQEENVGDGRRSSRERRVNIKEILITFARIGVLCSMESPNDRMEMDDVIAELCVIRDKFLGNYRFR